MNTPRTSEYLTLCRNMRKCTNLLQLQGLKELVLNYHKEKKQDSSELLAIYIETESDLLPENVKPVSNYEDEILNIHHSKLSSK